MSKNNDRNNKIPGKIKDAVNWQLNRKQFLRTLLLGGVASQIPFSKVLGKSLSENGLLSDEQIAILSSVQEILFPKDGNGPGAKEINAMPYLLWVLADPEKDPEEIEYIINGIGWVDESAEEIFSKKYLKLNQSGKYQLIADISMYSWGESWLSVILTFIFEALLCDPQYGGNPDNMGWNWLNHFVGQPRPTTNLLYPEIMNTIRK